ncbi:MULTISPECIES: hypothetical protein [Brevibacterium]|mgnify:CR=1 FL=1|jgi:hypothetical protein|uniref:Integral membrane protein n=1 Tax=Brevibacterium salitolerans TaxID=1403566 RepID=A0ABP5HUS7_9MICO|nr:hypothetical protein [Brevibacterium sp.]
MEILRLILLFLHLLGMALIIGGYFANVKAPRVIPGMLHASFLQLLTGLALVGVAEMGPGDVDHAKIAVKLVLALAVTVLALLGNRREKAAPGEGTSAGLAHGTVVAAVAAVAVAVFWT